MSSTVNRTSTSKSTDKLAILIDSLTQLSDSAFTDLKLIHITWVITEIDYLPELRMEYK